MRMLISGFVVKFLAAAAIVGLLPGIASEASAQQTLKVGAFVTASGPGADLGAQMRSGIEVAVERIAKEYTIDGKPAQIQVIWYDDEGKGDVGLSAVTRALTVDKINVAIGFNSTDIVSRVMGEFQKAAVPFVVAAAGGTSIFHTIAAQKMNYVFQLSPTADDMVPSLMKAALAKFKPKKLSALNYNIDAAHEQATMALKLLKENSPGSEVLAEEYVPLGTSDFTQQLLKLKRLGVDVIYTDIYGAGAPIFFEQYNELRVPALIVHLGTSVSADSFVQQNGKAMNGSLVNVRWVVGDYTPISKSMVEAYTKKMGSSPTAFAVQAHDSAVVMLEAVRNAKSVDPKAIASALENGTFTGAWGMRHFSNLADGHRMPVDVTIVQIQDGKKVVVYPESVAKTQGDGKYQPVPPYSWEKR
jgi:branched-chain amino acid transport system substrate-binding protein